MLGIATSFWCLCAKFLLPLFLQARMLYDVMHVHLYSYLWTITDTYYFSC